MASTGYMYSHAINYQGKTDVSSVLNPLIFPCTSRWVPEPVFAGNFAGLGAKQQLSHISPVMDENKLQYAGITAKSISMIIDLWLNDHNTQRLELNGMLESRQISFIIYSDSGVEVGGFRGGRPNPPCCCF